MKGPFAIVALLLASLATAQIDPGLKQDWMARWEKNILGDSRNRYCDKETGEEIGWLISPFLDGFYNGYLATHDTKWIDRLIDWTDSWIGRGVKEPDGYIGWPKAGTGGLVEDQLFTDSLLGEAMGFRPVVLLSGLILKDPSLRKAYGSKAVSYLALAEKTFQKWDSRGCWRDVKEGGLWVVPAFGLDMKGPRIARTDANLDPQSLASWTAGYANRTKYGFSNPANKENAIAEWMIALYDVTKKRIYRERAEKWFRVMKSRIRTKGGHLVWNYWDPAGPWDYKPDGTTRHWVGVHPNGGYYGIDVAAMVLAYEHGIVFTKADIDQLIATNRDFMWNHEIQGAKFSRMDGGDADPRWKNSPGVLWTGLLPYDSNLRKVFEANHDPSSWGGLAATPWYVARMSR
ncbi:MAG: hypothetical protein ACHQ50_03200 [Fimbriimonadales bacterium]